MAPLATDQERIRSGTLRYWRVILGLAVVSLIIGLLVWFGIARSVRITRQRFVRLLAETDYQVLLEACRKLSARVGDGTLKPGQYSVRSHRDPETSEFPRLLLGLEPNHIVIGRDGMVTIVMWGIPYCGVYAYPEDYTGRTYGLGEAKLIPGLYFFHEDYEKYPDLREYVDTLIEKGKSRLAQTSSAITTIRKNESTEREWQMRLFHR